MRFRLYLFLFVSRLLKCTSNFKIQTKSLNFLVIRLVCAFSNVLEICKECSPDFKHGTGPNFDML